MHQSVETETGVAIMNKQAMSRAFANACFSQILDKVTY